MVAAVTRRPTVADLQVVSVAAELKLLVMMLSLCFYASVCDDEAADTHTHTHTHTQELSDAELVTLQLFIIMSREFFSRLTFSLTLT